MTKPRILFCITVYNGRAIVPRCLDSAMRMDHGEAEVDVLLLDDASPAPGWSDELRQLAERAGAHYYRTPRNLGIPRNVNLGLLTAVKRGYDYVVINNSDVVFPRNLIPELLKAAMHPGVGSVTACSNNVSIYSLPNEDPNRFLADQAVVDWLSTTIGAHYSGQILDVPAGISFCIMIPSNVIRDVGLMDPVFGRGYCEETDWSLRSLAAGHRVCLALGTFVYHEGQGSNLAAGIVTNHGTVPENEAVIDLRYPQFREQCAAFFKAGKMPAHHAKVINLIFQAAAAEFGYTIEVGWLPRATDDEKHVRAHVLPDLTSETTVTLAFQGFRQTMVCPSMDVGKALRKRFGREPAQVNMLDRGGMADRLRAAFDPMIVTELRNYPSRV